MGKNHRNGIGKLVVTFGLGAAAGSAATALIAPASGRLLRRRLAGRFLRLGRRAGSELKVFRRQLKRELARTQRVVAAQAAHVFGLAEDQVSHARAWMTDHWLNSHPVARNGHGERRRRSRTVVHRRHRLVTERA